MKRATEKYRILSGSDEDKDISSFPLGRTETQREGFKMKNSAWEIET